MKTQIQTKTGGGGYWSRLIRPVLISEITVVQFNEEIGELRAHFISGEWNCDEFGLIYTDKKWIATFREELVKLGFSQEAVDSIDYSEQGMQGVNYVSLDVGKPFLAEWSLIPA